MVRVVEAGAVSAWLPVRLDGIFLMEFNAERECTLFREWWHSDEALPAEHAQDRAT
jgi:hypothetical protein